MLQEPNHIHEELKAAGSKLDSLLRKDTMRVPDGYFEQLEARLMEVPDLEKPAGRVFRLKWLSIAAAAMVTIVIGGYFLMRDKTAQPLHMELAEMDSDELDAWYDAQLASISYEELYAYLEEGVSALETSDLFSTDFADTASITHQLHDQIEEQVHTGTTADETKILEDHYIETIGEDAIEMFLHEEFILEDIGL